ncbi:MAG: tRNA 2-thiouridine(34) synthase MnmA [Actinomycetota bacterium]|nr:tRNA 2-thiouridine(34) synthase MnmA [Actinomycetota bacterium]
MNSRKKSAKVAVALSGGRDSAAAALLLKERGLEIIGLTFLLPGSLRENEKIAKQASAVAKSLGIKHKVIDTSHDFERLVVAPLLSYHLKGKTPNPCVTCNRKVKFGLLLGEATKIGASFLATGHYAKIETDSRGGYRLFRAKDRSKDQTYFLWTLDQETLSRVLLPLSDVKKNDLTKLLGQAGIPVEARQSQDICFLKDEKYSQFLKRSAGNQIKPGPIIDMSGKQIGEHKGIAFYTIGQRKGLGLGRESAFYVVDIVPEKNAIVVGDMSDLHCGGLELESVNFISGGSLAKEIECVVQNHYRGPLHPAVLYPSGSKGKVIFKNKAPKTAPGQSCVFYIGEELIGGGEVERNIG